MPSAICFGEVLWDVFPTYKNIGGAPLNVALRLQSFGVHASIISRIGDDDNGKEILEFINDKGVDASNIQLDKNHKTGSVKVILDENGSAQYEIEYPVAWDKIEVTKKVVETIRSSDAFIFGSLACRDEVSKNTLLDLLQYATYKVFDVNLRPPFYTMEVLLKLMNKADFIKCNDEELREICTALDFDSVSIMEQIKFLAQHTQTKQICVTKGSEGAVLFIDSQFYSNSGYPVKVADTVGAGDSFLA
ncbi:MAG: carbohydrate kinase, partial [Cyclobacteriaceae bacterium]|nr:carbohydrate kinase [Cyclobacteriaceae bacterium]